MQRLPNLILAAAVIALSGCARHVTTAGGMPSAGTYSWATESQPTTGNARLDRPELNSAVRSAIDEALKQRGFTKTTGRGAAFTVRYFVALDDADEVVGLSRYYRPGLWWIGYPRTYDITGKRGVLFVDLIDTAKKTLLWRGSAQGCVDPEGSPEGDVRRAERAAEKILVATPG